MYTNLLRSFIINESSLLINARFISDDEKTDFLRQIVNERSEDGKKSDLWSEMVNARKNKGKQRNQLYLINIFQGNLKLGTYRAHCRFKENLQIIVLSGGRGCIFNYFSPS